MGTSQSAGNRNAGIDDDRTSVIRRETRGGERPPARSTPRPARPAPGRGCRRLSRRDAEGTTNDSAPISGADRVVVELREHPASATRRLAGRRPPRKSVAHVAVACPCAARGLCCDLRVGDGLTQAKSSRRHEFLVLLKDDDDAGGLARLLNDVRAPEAEGLAEFHAPRPGGGAFLRNEEPSSIDGVRAAGEPRTLLLEDEPELERLIPDHLGSFIVGLSNAHDAERYANDPRVVTFVASGPLDFAAETMDRFSGPNAPLPLFDPDEAARMRALASDFPIDLEGATRRAVERLEEGSQYLAEGRVEDALSAFNDALEAEPSWAEAQLWRGYALRQILDKLVSQGLPVGDAREEARTAFRAAFDAAYPAPAEIGDNLLQLDDAAGAVMAYRRAVDQEPKAAWLHKSLGTALALDEELDDRFEQGCVEYTRALELDPDNAGALSSRGVVKINLCRYHEALQDLDRAGKLEGGENPATHLYRAIALSALGDLIEARRAAVQASRIGAKSDRPQWIEYVYAVVLLRLDDVDGAQTALKHAEKFAVERDDFNVVAKVKAVSGLIFARLDRFHEAHAACDSSIQHDHSEPGPYATQAWMFHTRNRTDEAGDAIALAVDLVETNVDWIRGCRFVGAKWPFYVTQASILNALSERYADENLAVDAIQATQKAWDDFRARSDRQSPPDAERGAQIFLERAYASVLCNRPGEAAAALREARALAPLRSRPWLAATRALREVSAPPRIRSATIVLAEGVALAGLVALLQFGKLSSGAFATLVIGVLALGLVAFLLPTITRFRLGTLEVEKAVASTGAQATPRLAAPLPPPHIAVPRPQVTRPLTVLTREPSRIADERPVAQDPPSDPAPDSS